MAHNQAKVKIRIDAATIKKASEGKCSLYGLMKYGLLRCSGNIVVKHVKTWFPIFHERNVHNN